MSGISHESLENNAQKLYFLPYGPYFAKNNELKEICTCPIFGLLGYIVFWIVDFLTCGTETEKIHQLALATLKEMSVQMGKVEPRWHFSGDERFGMYSGCPVPARTYKDLAKKFLNPKHWLYRYEDIRLEAQNIINQFQALDLTKNVGELTRKDVIRHVRGKGIEPELNQPSVTPVELESLWKNVLSERRFLGVDV